MCDYSLERYRSRPARAGERYVLIRFASGSNGFVSPGDCSTAVCVPYDTRMELAQIPTDLQDELGVGPREEVVFTQVDNGRYRDGVVFANGTPVSLQRLTPGITAVLRRSLGRIPAALERKPELEKL